MTYINRRKTTTRAEIAATLVLVQQVMFCEVGNEI